MRELIQTGKLKEQLKSKLDEKVLGARSGRRSCFDNQMNGQHEHNKLNEPVKAKSNMAKCID